MISVWAGVATKTFSWGFLQSKWQLLCMVVLNEILHGIMCIGNVTCSVLILTS